MKNITSPLSLKNKISSPSTQWDIVPFVDILSIALLLSLLGSYYLNAPGLSIELPRGSSEVITTQPIATVLTVNRDNMLFFEGEVYSHNDIENALNRYTKSHKMKESTLLVKLGKNVSISSLFEICEIAKRSGFEKIHVAGNETPTDGIRKMTNELL